jgi:hypothetical protein
MVNVSIPPIRSPPTDISVPAGVPPRPIRASPPGGTINVADNMWNFGTTALDAAFRRR